MNLRGGNGCVFSPPGIQIPQRVAQVHLSGLKILSLVGFNRL
jgi:hypothetical protein